MIERFLNPDNPQDREAEMRTQLEKGLNCFNLFFDQSIKDEIKQRYLNSEDFALILGSNHQSHADIFPYILIADQLSKEVDEIKGFNMIIAVSLTTGQQNQDLKDYYKIINEMCLQKNINFIPIVRPKDVEKYGVSDLINIPNLKKVMRSHKNQHVLIEFPEGTVQGGRLNLDTNLPFGVQKTNDSNVIDYCVAKYLRKEIDFGVLPVAIDGTYKIYPPDTYKITIPTEKINVTVGSLLKPDDFQNSAKSVRPSDLLMQKIVPNLSIETRGKFYV